MVDGDKKALEDQLKGLEKVLNLPNMQALYDQILQQIEALNNPNPIIFGLMAMITFWPSLILIVIGIIIQLTKP